MLDRLNERVTYFETRREAVDFCRRALANREPSFTVLNGSKVSKVISDDLVFIIDTKDPWNIVLITVYNYSEYQEAI